ncbi:histidine kinase dimerization/phospho-acceptor domain-containing protein [Candidatus Solirubrobacter pratensis]|jgi:signal transduction histidine kinase|uniref:histidine kinase dimerization/phospho-acceptor domain-containing protein n=1 Tax=Candidatus Solirubrobacter pratensis TaxID=1298857 RepID=UPI00041106B9|nr:histidine kinase dimerization/phospho-acceptor domain-containing protein [Candidatus Solirubrobacter pratensis]
MSDDLVLDGESRRRLRHDLRTPLTIVAGFAEVLAADRPISDQDRRDFAKRIQDAASEIRELIDSVLEG